MTVNVSPSVGETVVSCRLVGVEKWSLFMELQGLLRERSPMQSLSVISSCACCEV